MTIEQLEYTIVDMAKLLISLKRRKRYVVVETFGRAPTSKYWTRINAEQALKSRGFRENERGIWVLTKNQEAS